MKATSAIAQNATSQYALIEAQWAATQDLVDLPRNTARAVWGRRNTELVRSAGEVELSAVAELTRYLQRFTTGRRTAPESLECSNTS